MCSHKPQLPFPSPSPTTTRRRGRGRGKDRKGGRRDRKKGRGSKDSGGWWWWRDGDWWVVTHSQSTNHQALPLSLTHTQGGKGRGQEKDRTRQRTSGGGERGGCGETPRPPQSKWVTNHKPLWPLTLFHPPPSFSPFFFFPTLFPHPIHIMDYNPTKNKKHQTNSFSPFSLLIPLFPSLFFFFPNHFHFLFLLNKLLSQKHTHQIQRKTK